MLDLDKTGIEMIGKLPEPGCHYGFIFDDLDFRTMPIIDTVVSLRFSVDLLDLFHFFIPPG